jgi:hypothetical protein
MDRAGPDRMADRLGRRALATKQLSQHWLSKVVFTKNITKHQRQKASSVAAFLVPPSTLRFRAVCFTIKFLLVSKNNPRSHHGCNLIATDDFSHVSSDAGGEILIKFKDSMSLFSGLTMKTRYESRQGQRYCSSEFPGSLLSCTIQYSTVHSFTKSRRNEKRNASHASS